jgi:hypothetical protein
MRRFVDLHTHTTASDGTLTPRALVALADRAQLAAVAVTDHDTVDGLAEAQAAARRYEALRLVPGIEVSAAPPSGTLHLLGLGIDAAAPSVSRLGEFMRGSRAERNPRIVARLQALGVAIDMDDVRGAAAAIGAAGQVISRLHVAEALRRGGHVRTTKEAFERYLGRGAAAYVERRRPPAAEAIAAIHEAGGLAVLAHPVQLACDNRAQLERIVRDLAAAGLDAVEAYHSDHTPEQTRSCLDLAERLHLAVSGGSDFHGQPKPGAKVGRPRVPVAALGEAFAARLGL